MRTLIAVLGFVGVAATASAQATGPAATRTSLNQLSALGQPMFSTIATARTTSSCCGSSLTANDEARHASMMSFADAMFASGQLNTARRVLRDVVARQKDGSAYPAVALRRLANVEYALDHPLAAANALEELAASAARVGDPTTQLGALVDASLLYVDIGRLDRQRALVQQIRPLLNSPSIPEATRLQIAGLLQLR